MRLVICVFPSLPCLAAPCGTAPTSANAPVIGPNPPIPPRGRIPAGPPSPGAFRPCDSPALSVWGHLSNGRWFWNVLRLLAHHAAGNSFSLRRTLQRMRRKLENSGEITTMQINEGNTEAGGMGMNPTTPRLAGRRGVLGRVRQASISARKLSCIASELARVNRSALQFRSGRQEGPPRK